MPVHDEQEGWAKTGKFGRGKLKGKSKKIKQMP
jgi:hypothetical protein